MEPKWQMDDLHRLFEKALAELLESDDAGSLDEHSLQTAVDESLKQVVPKLVAMSHADLTERANEMLFEHRELRRIFVEENMLRWKAGFDLLECLIVVSQEIGEAVNAAMRPEAAETGDALFEVLITNHSRAIIVAREILTLMVAGFPDGALARWRTLHEIAVESALVSKFGQDTAARYVRHFDVARYKRAVNYMEHHERADLQPIDDEVLSELRAQYDAIIAYDPRLKKPYGWAADAIGKEEPNFFDLEKAMNLDHWRPRYKWATVNSHGGYGQHLGSLGTSESQRPLLLVGESSSGMTDPGHMTAITLNMATFPITQLIQTIDGEVWMRVLTTIADEIGLAFIAAQRLRTEHADKS